MNMNIPKLYTRAVFREHHGPWCPVAAISILKTYMTNMHVKPDVFASNDRIVELEMKLRTAESALDNLQARFGHDNRQLLGNKRLALGQCYQALKTIRGQA